MTRKAERNPLFAGRWFEDEVILLCLHWYFRFKRSYRDLVQILGERGLTIAHTTILRWVVRYAETCEQRWRRFERPVGGSWCVDETFIKVPISPHHPRNGSFWYCSEPRLSLTPLDI